MKHVTNFKAFEARWSESDKLKKTNDVLGVFEDESERKKCFVTLSGLASNYANGESFLSLKEDEEDMLRHYPSCALAISEFFKLAKKMKKGWDIMNAHERDSAKFDV